MLRRPKHWKIEVVAPKEEEDEEEEKKKKKRKRGKRCVKFVVVYRRFGTSYLSHIHECNIPNEFRTVVR